VAVPRRGALPIPRFATGVAQANESKELAAAAIAGLKYWQRRNALIDGGSRPGPLSTGDCKGPCAIERIRNTTCFRHHRRVEHFRRVATLEGMGEL
jgi:hypothetical protein